ncbi:MAG: hypothetical protein ACRD1V_20390 [Vicinamibacterales bacterium]
MSAISRTTSIVFAMLFTASAAFAQAERPQRMFRGLFGGPGPRPDSQTEFDANVSIYGAYDEDLGASQGAVVDPRNEVGGAYSGVDLGLTFTHSGRHVDYAVTGGSSGRYYPTLHTLTTLGDQAAFSVGVHGRRASLQAIESGMYSPLFMLAPFATAVPTTAADVAAAPVNTAVQHETMFGNSTTLTGDLTLGPRWSLDSTEAFNTSRVRYGTGSASQRSWTAGATLKRQVSKDSALHLGYTEQNLLPLLGASTVSVHNLDLGMDYHKALGRTRKTTMSVNFGSGMVQDASAHLYTVLADASLNREIGRSWVAQANYHRGLGVVTGFNRPLLSDSVTASAGGLLTQRLDLNTSAAYTNGEIGITGLTNSFSGYNASARLRFAFSQMYAVYGEYIAYWYDLNNNLYVATPLPPSVLRQGVNVGLTLSLPLVR